MVRLIKAIFFIVFSSALWAQPSIVQSASNDTTGTTTASATLGAAVTAGDMVIVFASGGATALSFNTPTMTGETFTTWQNVGTNDIADSWATNSAVGGQKVVTVTSNQATDIHIHVVEVSGQTATPRDRSGTANSATLSVSTSAATTNANDLIIAYFYDNANNRTFTAGTGYTQVQQSNNVGGGDAGFSESKTVSTTGTQTATASGNSGDACQQLILAVAGTGSAGPTCTPSLASLGAGCS